MKIECASFAKYRNGSQPGDDVPLIMPGVIFGVFDGATDAEGTMIDGVGAGRFAALTVANAAARLAMSDEVHAMPTNALIGALSAALARATAPLSLRIPPSTTLVMALDCGTAWRFVILGDSGVRLNGDEVLRRNKLIDDVSTHARVALFNQIRSHEADADRAEMATRRAIFLGLDQAVAEDVLPSELARRIIADTIAATELAAHGNIVDAFLRGGIRTQHAHANAAGHPLCFGSMNGTTADLLDAIDVMRPKNSVHSIELFTDGYPTLPVSASLNDWEDAFAEAEALDFHKIGPLATVKGSTSTEFFDDRTVIVLSN